MDCFRIENGTEFKGLDDIIVKVSQCEIVFWCLLFFSASNYKWFTSLLRKSYIISEILSKAPY